MEMWVSVTSRKGREAWMGEAGTEGACATHVSIAWLDVGFRVVMDEWRGGRIGDTCVVDIAISRRWKGHGCVWLVCLREKMHAVGPT